MDNFNPPSITSAAELPDPPAEGVCECGSDDLHSAADMEHGQHVECIGCGKLYKWLDLSAD